MFCPGFRYNTGQSKGTHGNLQVKLTASERRIFAFFLGNQTSQQCSSVYYLNGLIRINRQNPEAHDQFVMNQISAEHREPSAGVCTWVFSLQGRFYCDRCKDFFFFFSLAASSPQSVLLSNPLFCDWFLSVIVPGC